MEALFFYDAIAPIVTFESINLNIAFRASRYERGELEDGDYINCPMTRRNMRILCMPCKARERIELKGI